MNYVSKLKIHILEKRHQILTLIIISVLSCIVFFSFKLYAVTSEYINNASANIKGHTKKIIAYSKPSTLQNPQNPENPNNPHKSAFIDDENKEYEIEILNASFLHNSMRNYYGDSAPICLEVIWKHDLGEGETQIGVEIKKWKGAGWTGQPLLVVENGKKYLIQGAYDHHLKKIDATTGELIWQYQYDDVIKGTGSIWVNTKARKLEDFCVILQGSRAGKSIHSGIVPSYRAISYFTGKELWRLNSAKTDSYSRDVDASALLLGDTAYIGLENGIFTIFNPNPTAASVQDDIMQPEIFKNSDTLYYKKDKTRQGGNLVTEASPALLGDRIYIASGSGHIWGYNLKTNQLDWDYYIGSDIDGSVVITDDSCLLVSIEKQYIKGKGGLLKLNPRKEPKEAAEWFFPTENKTYASWEGGIVGSASVNYHYKNKKQTSIAVFNAIDGFMYVVDTKNLHSNLKKTSYDTTLLLPQPKLLFKYKIGASISTPIIVQNKIISAGYSGIYLFEFDDDMNFKLLSENKIRCESTPVADGGCIYIASRNGYLYCLGGLPKEKKKVKGKVKNVRNSIINILNHSKPD